MSLARMILIVVILPAAALPVHAQGLFARKPKTNPNQHVPELIATLRSDADDRKRSAAAAELADYDANGFPAIVPALISSAQSDHSTSVRMDVITALSRVRPASQEVGQVLEMSASKDESIRVRVHAKTVLWRYEVAGLFNGKTGTQTAEAKKPSPKTPTAPEWTTTEPTFGQADSVVIPMPSQTPPAVTVSRTKVMSPPPVNNVPGTSSVPRAMPAGPSFSTAIPQEPHQVPRSVADGPPLDGPSLAPPPPAGADPW